MEQDPPSIDDILPEDAIQHILSFLGVTQLQKIQSVNQSWMKLSKRNERVHYLGLSEHLDQNSPIPYDSKINNTWIIHPKSRTLSKIEAHLGFKGPMNDIKLALKQCKSGDRLFLHEANYDLNAYHVSLIWNHVSIIGLGYNTIIKGNSTFCDVLGSVGNCNNNGRLYIENITLDYSDDFMGPAGIINVHDASLWMRKCKILCKNIGVNIGEFSFLNVDDCVFQNGNIGIDLKVTSREVNIRNSVFRNFTGDQACIQILTWKQDLNERAVRLICDGNVFEDNACCPISEFRDINFDSTQVTQDENLLVWYVERTDLYRLQNNIESIDANVEDANKIHDHNKIAEYLESESLYFNY